MTPLIGLIEGLERWEDRMALPKLISLAPNWTKDLKFPAVIQHKHNLPLCRPDRHHRSCEPYDDELACIKVVKGFDFKKNRFVFGAVCTHRYK